MDTEVKNFLGYKANRLVESQQGEIPQTGKAGTPVPLHTSNISTIWAGVYSCWSDSRQDDDDMLIFLNNNK